MRCPLLGSGVGGPCRAATTNIDPLSPKCNQSMGTSLLFVLGNYAQCTHSTTDKVEHPGKVSGLSLPQRIPSPSSNVPDKLPKALFYMLKSHTHTLQITLSHCPTELGYYFDVWFLQHKGHAQFTHHFPNKSLYLVTIILMFGFLQLILLML